MPPLISASGLTKRFGHTVALSDVSFSVDAGEVFGVFGPNGAGKTTLLRLLTGEMPADGGELRILGLDPFESSKRVKALTGIVPEVESPPSYLTAEEYFDFVLAVRGVKDGSARRKWFDFFDMQDRDTTLCRDLSKGTRQKLMLAGALVHDPELLLLDEPFINLDPIYQKRMREYLAKRRSEGKTTFINTHILEIAQRLCTSVLILDRGRVVARGSMDDIMAHGDGRLEDLFMRVVGKEG